MKNRILIVDDNEEINQLVLLYLEKHGFLADQAVTFADAQSLLKTESYDLVLLDWDLDGNNTGLDLLSSVDKMTKVLLFSANSNHLLLQAYNQYPRINDFMSKDFRDNDLMVKIRALLDIY
jgi:two-component system response regulator ResD